MQNRNQNQWQGHTSGASASLRSGCPFQPFRFPLPSRCRVAHDKLNQLAKMSEEYTSPYLPVLNQHEPIKPDTRNDKLECCQCGLIHCFSNRMPVLKDGIGWWGYFCPHCMEESYFNLTRHPKP